MLKRSTAVSRTHDQDNVGSTHQNEGFQPSEHTPHLERNSTGRRNDPHFPPENKKHGGWSYWGHTEDDWLQDRYGQMEVHQNSAEPWRVTLLDTGESTMTGGRIKRVRSYLGEDDFCCTYGDGVGDVDIARLIEFHKTNGTLATLTATKPPDRFGSINMSENKIINFQEKPEGDGAWINGGFFILSPKVLDYIEGDETIWERAPMERLAKEGQISAYLHDGFWQPMDTLRDKTHLEELWSSGKAPWKMW